MSKKPLMMKTEKDQFGTRPQKQHTKQHKNNKKTRR